MFWKYNVSSSPQIEALLGKDDVTLQEVMNSDDIINECRVQNKTLIDFLQKPNIMEELVTLTTKEPSVELDEHVRFKYSNIACELLTCDVPALNERLASDELLLEKLYNFLDGEPPLNPLLASFFSKIIGALIAKKTEQVLDFLKAKDTFISLLLKHLGTSAIMDLMLKLFTQVEGVETKLNILNWLDSQQIMQSLVSMLNPNIDNERHYNAAQLLCDFIRIVRDNQRTSSERTEPDPLLNTLESSEIIALLLDKILTANRCESSTIGGIQVLLALLDVNQNGISKFNSSTSYHNLNDESNEVEQKQKVLLNITNALLERLADFHELLLKPPKGTPMEFTICILDPPLGQTRLQVMKLYAAVISSNNNDLLHKIISQGTFSLMLDLFFEYPWNNFLHTQVERCLVVALKTYVSEDSDDTSIALCKHLLENCKLIERLLDAWNKNEEQQKANGVRQGYMGHLINILNEVIDSSEKSYFGQFLKESFSETYTSLEEFKENTLNEVNKVHRALLGGVHPNISNNNDSGDYNDTSLPHSLAFQQQLYAEYQMQYTSSRFIEGYSGYNDDAFNDEGNTLQPIDHRTDMDFDLSDNSIDAQVFEQLCSENINTLKDAEDEIFEDKDNSRKSFTITVHDQKEQVYGSINDDDEEEEEDDDDDDSPNESNDAYLWSPTKHEPGGGDALEVNNADPWSNSSSTLNKNETWADFTSATFDADFSNAFENHVSTSLDKTEGCVLTSLENAEEETGNLNEKEADSVQGEENLNVIDVLFATINEMRTSLMNVAQENADSPQQNTEILLGDEGSVNKVNEVVLNGPCMNTSDEDKS